MKVYIANYKALEDIKRSETTRFQAVFIAISKLCCLLCYKTFKVFNKIENHAYIIVRGTHGKFYLGWSLPISLNFIEAYQRKIEKFIEKKIRNMPAIQETANDNASMSASGFSENYAEYVRYMFIVDGEMLGGII